MIIIKGIEFDISFTDADVIERYENAAYAMKEAVADKSRFKGMSTANAVREQCKIMEKYIDDTLQCDSANIMFNGKMDLMEHMIVCDEINKRAAESKKAVSDLNNKYVQMKNSANGGNNSVRNFNGGKHHGKGGNN